MASEGEWRKQKTEIQRQRPEVEDRGALSLVLIGSAVKTVRLQQVAAQVLKERRKLKLGKG